MRSSAARLLARASYGAGDLIWAVAGRLARAGVEPRRSTALALRLWLVGAWARRRRIG